MRNKGSVYLAGYVFIAAIIAFILLMVAVANASEIKVVNHCHNWTPNQSFIQKVFDKTVKITGIQIDTGEIIIEVFQTKGDLLAYHQSKYRTYGGAAWYDHSKRTIYISRQTFAECTLAHEFTHVLIHSRYGEMSKEINEVIPNWVEDQFYYKKWR